MPTCLLLVSLGLALLAPQGKADIVYDDFQNAFQLGAPPQRIVSLAPNITELLFAIGLGDRVIGVTRYCDYPPSATEKEKIGGMVDPNIEKIQALRPDLIIAFRGNPIGTVNKLKSLHFPVFVLDIGKSLDVLFLMIEKVGRVTRAESAAERLLVLLRQRFQAIRTALQGVEHKPRVFLLLHGQGLWTCGQESYLHDLLVQAEAVNIAGGIRRRWLQLSREKLIQENPEVILIMAKDKTQFSQARESLLADPRLKTVAAIENLEIRFLDENIASRFGPRLIEALFEVARILHPREIKAGS
jgi:iron complex transport system substrate-binding protein